MRRRLASRLLRGALLVALVCVAASHLAPRLGARFAGRPSLGPGTVLNASERTHLTSTLTSTLSSTATALSCTPASPSTGSATTCTVTVTSDGADAPTGSVTFSSAPSSGTFSGGSACALAASGSDSSACEVTFTPSAGGPFTVSGSYGGDTANQVSDGQTDIESVDATSTTVSCPTTGVTTGAPLSCTATVTDPGGTQAIYGSVEFTTTPADAGSVTPGACGESSGGSSTTVTCPVQFTPSQAGAVTVTATYCGDAGESAPASTCTNVPTDLGGDHAPSMGSTGVTVHATPTGTDDASTLGASGISGDEGAPAGTGPGTTAPGPSTPAPVAVITIGAKRLRLPLLRRVVTVPVRCKGAKGLICEGKIALTVEVRVLDTSPVPGAGASRYGYYTIQIGLRAYHLKAQKSGKVRVTLTRAGLRILTAVKTASVTVTVSATQLGGAVASRGATLVLHPAPAPKKTKTKHRDA